MPYCGAPELVDYFNSTAYPDWPVRAPVCAFVQGGAGVPGVVLSLVFFGTVGMALSYRVQHPGPIVVAGLLTAGSAALSSPGSMMNIVGIVVFLGISVAGIYIYTRMQRTL